MDFDHLPPLDPRHGTLRVVVETPRGSRNKYAYDPVAKALRLSRVLPAGMAFPFDFGFLPQTRAPDGDPLDVVVLLDEPVVPGCVVESRLLGVIEAEQTENGHTTRNDRLVAAACLAAPWADARTLADLPAAVLEPISRFFVDYHERQRRTFQPLGHRGPEIGRQLLDAAHRAW